MVERLIPDNRRTFNGFSGEFELRHHHFSDALCTLFDGRDLRTLNDTISPLTITDDGHIAFAIPDSLNAVYPFTVYPPARFVVTSPDPHGEWLDTKPWDIRFWYEPLAECSYQGVLYRAQISVPPGTPIEDRRFWKPFNYKNKREPKNVSRET